MTDFRLIAVISAAHFVSHFVSVVLPPLFPVLRDEFGVSYVALGFLMTLVFTVGGVGQAVSGFLVDRFGARLLLLAGTVTIASAVLLAGLATSFAMLVVVMLLGALGNSVFHPADYSIFNLAIDSRRLGRAYSFHGIGGTIGFAVGPLVIVALATLHGWRTALVAIGLAGLAWAAVLARETAGVPALRRIGPRPVVARAASVGAAAATEPSRRPGLAADLSLVCSAPVLAAFAYFTLLAAATAGLTTFSIAALVTIYSAPLTVATSVLTGYLVGKSVGVFAGGFLADRTSRHDVLAAGGMLGGAAFMFVIAGGASPLVVAGAAMALAGFSIGIAQPSRDLLVRAATPQGASGKVFGFAYSGLDLGSALTPLAFGWLLDHGHARSLFVAIGMLMLATIVTVVEVRRRSDRP